MKKFIKPIFQLRRSPYSSEMAHTKATTDILDFDREALPTHSRSPPYRTWPSVLAPLESMQSEELTEESSAITNSPQYRNLLARNRRTNCANMVLLWLSVALASFLYVTNSNLGDCKVRSAQARTQARPQADLVTYFPAPSVDTSSSVQIRDADGVHRCITGLKKAELERGFRDMRAAAEDRAKVWTVPCAYVEELNYPNDVEAEYHYVVLKEVQTFG